ncbi:MAG: metallophosphoesterase family protein [Aestuariivirga sp.]|uniref:metallophosphoesterase family protein n=1 Tax=Aestuariivirga sp. TaxID=2650926 RepID=UPI0038D19FC2
MTPLLDPRNGDIEDDASSTKQRSLLSLGGSLLAEIGLGKLVVAWVMLIALPGLALGFLPLLASLWIGKFSTQAQLLLTGLGSLITLAILAAAIWFGGRPAMRAMEASFWSLQGIGIQPGYVVGREALRHLAERIFKPGSDSAELRRIRSLCSLLSAVILSLFAAWIATLAWPYTRWTSSLAEFAAPLQLLGPVIANAVAILAIYFSVASLLWGIADASMAAPVDLRNFATVDSGARRWRIAHLSDIHVVAGPYGFRIESGRAGPRGNQRLEQVWARLATIHERDPIDLILISGDLTDAGLSTEWAAFFDTLAPYPQLVERIVGLPGNHDLNVVDRANPARLELPTSPLKRLRQLRMLSALDALQGTRTQVLDPATGKLGPSLKRYLEPHHLDIAAFADMGSFKLSLRLADIADLAFPMIVPPTSEEGLGLMILNSNADTHFSFTNALGMMSLAQSRAVESVAAHYPRAGWIIALHHHVVEYPKPATALSERIGTALINGSYVVRRLQKLGGRAILMHGHRHIEWIGTAGGLIIVSAPSPVMDATDTDTTHFFIHTVATAGNGTIALLTPEKVTLPGAGTTSAT